MEREQQLLDLIRQNPYISQQELATKTGISRSAVAGYIATLMKKGKIQGRAYVLAENRGVVCIGGANVDEKVHGKQDIRFGTSNPVFSTESCGGVIRNVAENLGRLSSDVVLVTAVGQDREGKWLLEETHKQGVDVSHVWELQGQRTGTYTALLDPHGELVISFANMDIYDAITPEMIDQMWSTIARTQFVAVDTNIPASCLEQIIMRCRQEGIPVCVDPVSSEKAKKLPASLEGVEVILPNQEEAELLAGIPIASSADYAKAAARIHERGVKHVIITLGKDGIFYSGPTQQMQLLPYPTKVVEVTGAGDSFMAGFLFGLLQKEDVVTACKLGLAASHLTLQTEDSVSKQLTAENIYKMIKERSHEPISFLYR